MRLVFFRGIHFENQNLGSFVKVKWSCLIQMNENL